MGQRLNIEIKENGVVLANAYYHWSAYTSSSLELTQMVLESIKECNYEDRIVNAIKLLEKTGSGLTQDEITYAHKTIVGFENYEFEETEGRNDGLTAISPRGIKETEAWEEHRVEIDLNSKTIKFGVFWDYPKEQYENEYADDDDTKYNDIPICDLGLSSIPFDKFEEIKEKIKDFYKSDVYKIRTGIDGNVVWFIH